MKAGNVVLLAALWVGALFAGPEEPRLEKYGVDPERKVDGEYRGRFAPDGNYVLDGKLREDIGPLPENPYRFLTAEEGYDASAFPAPPPSGVHPRVLMNPDDIVNIRAKVKMGAGAGRYFQVVWKDIQQRAARPYVRTTAGMQNNLLERALVALVTEDDQLGRETADLFMEEVEYYDCLVDLLNSHPDLKSGNDSWYYYSRVKIAEVGGVGYEDAYREGGAKLVRELAKKSVSLPGYSVTGYTQKHHSMYLFNSPIFLYDYLYKYLTEQERTKTRKLLSKMTYGRYTSGMGLPGNMFINNHQSMGEDLLLHVLAIEGEEGYDPRILEEYSHSVLCKLTYDVSPGGHLHEKCKGFLPERAAVAITKRQTFPLLSLDRMRAMVMAKVMDSNNLFERYIGETSTPKGLEIGTGNQSSRRWYMGLGSGPWMDQFFNWAFVVKKAFPHDPVVDYFYKQRMQSNGMGSPDVPLGDKDKMHRIRYTHRDLMLLCVTAGLTDEQGNVVNYDKTGLPEEIRGLPVLWVDMNRGVAMTRNGWDPDDLMVHYECRSDVYSAGHETPEANDFYLYANGVEWTTRRLWYHDCYFRNMVLIDGYAGIWSPVAGKLMLAEDDSNGSTFVSDATDQYNWRKIEKNFYSWHPMVTEAYMHMGAYPGGKWGRDWEVPFQKQMRVYHEGYAGLDWGNWHGETRGPEMFQRWNAVDHVFRTMHLSKGEAPYALVIDDVRKDDQPHSYDWCMLLSPDIVLYEGDSSVRGRYLEKGMPESRWTDLHLTTVDVPFKRYQQYGFNCHREAKKGDPMLLVRVLWRESEFAYPQPSVEQGYGPARVIIPSVAVDPKFRVLIYPYRFGDEMPLTTWNEDQTQLTVRVGDVTDVYTFSETDRERTVFTKTRNGRAVTTTAYGPAMPVLDLKTGYTADRNDVNEIREIVFHETMDVRFKSPGLDKIIRYTLDGSEPNGDSLLYSKPIIIESSGVLKAKTFARYWPYREDNSSETLTVKLIEQLPIAAVTTPESVLGLRCDIYEVFMTIFDKETGIFTGKKNLLPAFKESDLIRSCRVENVRVPASTPKASAVEMEWGYYRLSGFLKVEKEGVYNFKLNSCGPVELKVGGQDVIAVSGVYGLSQKDRFGGVVLAEGFHPFSLVVTDPVYWKNGAEEGPYHIDFQCMPPGSSRYEAISDRAFCCGDAALALDEPDPIPVGKAVQVDGLGTGLHLSKYYRKDFPEIMPYEGLALAQLDPENPGVKYAEEHAMAFPESQTPRALYQLDGYINIGIPGIYRFATDSGGANRLFVDDVEIVRNKVIGPQLSGQIELDIGLHKFRLLAAGSRCGVSVQAPDGAAAVSAPIGMFSSREIEPFSDGRLVAEIIPVIDKDNRLPLNGLVGNAVAKIHAGEIVEGRKGKAIKLNGGQARIELTDLPSPESATSMTAWIRMDNPGNAALMNDDATKEPCYVTLGGTRGKAGFWRASDAALFDLRKPSEDQSLGGWRHIAFTFGESVAVYVDGELVAEKPKTVPERSAHTRKKILFDGFDGAVEDVRIYNKVLSAEEVEALAKM